MNNSNSNPLCTIVIPTIGRPKHFGQALASVATQTYSPMEILISDNAAIPAVTSDEIQKYAPNANVRLLRRNERMNGPDHFNQCFKDATGEYIFLFADDDIMTPDFIRTAMDAILADNDVKVVVAVQDTISEEFAGNITNPKLTSLSISGHEFAKLWPNGKAPGIQNISALLARKLDLLSYSGFRPYPTGSGSDIFIFFQLCLGHKVGIVNGGYLYRVYESSVGLSAPWDGLYAAVDCLDRDLYSLFTEGRLDKATAAALIRNNTRFLFNRWKSLYYKRLRGAKLLRSVMDLARRLAILLFKYGIDALPLLHKVSLSKTPIFGSSEK